MKLNEITQLRSQAELFLAKWTEGSTRAVLHLSPGVRADLRKTVTEASYKVYRGWKFAEPKDLADVFGMTHHDLKPGAHVTVNLETLHSWTKDKAEAIKFSNPHFDSFEKKWFDDEAIKDYGYEHGDLLGIGILVEAMIPAEHVLADLENVDSSLLQYDNEESEIITDKGSFTVKVIAVDVHHFHKSTEEEETDDMDENDWEEHNRESAEENEHMIKTRDELPALLKKHGLKADEAGIKKLLDLEKRQDVAIAVIMEYGSDFPAVKKYAVSHAASYAKVYKHFTVKGISQIHDSIEALGKMDHSKWEAED
jgi:hypothetical protein